MAQTQSGYEVIRRRGLADEAAKREVLLKFERRVSAKGGVKTAVGTYIRKLVKASAAETERIQSDLDSIGGPERLRAMSDKAAEEFRTGIRTRPREQPAEPVETVPIEEKPGPERFIGGAELLASVLDDEPASPPEPEPEPEREEDAPTPSDSPAEEVTSDAGDAGEPQEMTTAEIHKAQEQRAHAGLMSRLAAELDALKARDVKEYALHIGMKQSRLMKGAVNEDGKPIIDEETGKQKLVPDTETVMGKLYDTGEEVPTELARWGYAGGERSLSPSLTGGGVFDGTMPVEGPLPSARQTPSKELVEGGPLQGLHISNAEEL